MRKFGQNSPRINEKKKIMDSCSSFWNKQDVFYGILEDYSSFCTRIRVVIKPFILFFQVPVAPVQKKILRKFFFSVGFTVCKTGK